MKERTKEPIKTCATPFERLRGKAVIIFCPNGIVYNTKCLNVDADTNSVFFLDKFGDEVVLSISQIVSVKEVRHGN